MKRVLTILAILLLPLSVWAMTPVTDSDLSSVTGQAGVSINQDVMMNIHMDVMAWGDADGLGNVGPGYNPINGHITTMTTGLNPWTTVSAGGYIGIKNFDMSLQVKARTTDTYNGYNTFQFNGTIEGSSLGATAGTVWAGYPGLRPLTIDVATTATNQDPNLYGTGVTFVRIGLGAMEIDVSAMSFDIALSPRPASGAPALNQVLGTVSMGAIGIFINPNSYVDIYNGARGTGSGVSFGIHMIIDQFNMDYISWGDKDGFTNTDTSDNGFAWAAYTSAGYIGLGTLRVGGPITITGTVNIDVGSVTHGYYQAAGSILSNGHITKVPMVHITFGNMSSIGAGVGGTGTSVGPVLGPNTAYGVGFEVDVPSITANVCLSSTANLALNATGVPASANQLGDIYISGLKFQMVKGSWVDIFAH